MNYTATQCDICGKKYIDKGKCDNTIQIADGENIFIQDVCGKCLEDILEKLKEMGWEKND